MVENLAIINFEDFSLGFGNQHVASAHIGPAGPGIRRRQIALLPLLDVVFWREVQRRYGIADVNCLKSAVTPSSSYFCIPSPVAAHAPLAQANSTPRSIIFVLRIISPLLSWTQNRSLV
jgi:hypothetical protein